MAKSDSREPSTEIGRAFELRVANLLKSCVGYRNVREQEHICGKNVDIIFEKKLNPRKFRTIAVECKNWRKGINRKALLGVYLEYKPLFDAKAIDELWLVTPFPPHATVREFADDFSGMELLHISELERDVIDFSVYAGFLKSLIDKDYLSRYYIQPRVEGREELLHDQILKWLKSEGCEPVAIWAEYGMGKTSYAIFLASQLASDYLRDSSNRIPILIALGDFYTSPRIDGLFSNALTNTKSGVDGYNFITFSHLHEAGRFVIILDGFDEMKHAMTKSEFNSISKEIRQLVCPNSKVILLGRPDAIITGEEHATIATGKRNVAGFEINDEIGATFLDLRLDFFTTTEYLKFLRGYMECFYRGEEPIDRFIEKRLSEVAALELGDILKRPVQARMLALILLNPKNSIRNFSKYDLYKMFIDECVAREQEKHERRIITPGTRRRFMQEVAWWLWAIKRTRSFSISEMPNSLIGRFIEAGEDPLGTLRELLVGSVIEEQAVGSLLAEKNAGTFYFPHLSFEEFLVAEGLVEGNVASDSLAVLSDIFNEQIGSFLESCRACDALYVLYNNLANVGENLTIELLRFVSKSPTLKNELRKPERERPKAIWQFAVDVLALFAAGEPSRGTRICTEWMMSDNVDQVSISVHLFLKEALDDPNLSLASLLLVVIFRKITIRHLIETVRDVSPVEAQLLRLLSTIKITIEGKVGDEYTGYFSVDFRELFLKHIGSRHGVIQLIDDNDIIRQTPTVRVPLHDVRKEFISLEDRNRFDIWLRQKEIWFFDSRLS